MVGCETTTTQSEPRFFRLCEAKATALHLEQRSLEGPASFRARVNSVGEALRVTAAFIPANRVPGIVRQPLLFRRCLRSCLVEIDVATRRIFDNLGRADSAGALIK